MLEPDNSFRAVRRRRSRSRQRPGGSSQAVPLRPRENRAEPLNPAQKLVRQPRKGAAANKVNPPQRPTPTRRRDRRMKAEMRAVTQPEALRQSAAQPRTRQQPASPRGADPGRRLRAGVGVGDRALTKPTNPASQSSRRLRQANPRPRRRTSPAVHALRLLITGIGVGVIAGTVLSAWSPANYSAAVLSQSATETSGADVAQQSMLRQDATPAQALLAPAGLRVGQEMTALAQPIQALAAQYPGLTPAVFLLDLDTGNYFSLNGETVFATASMVKVPILVAFLQDVDAGKIRLDEVLTMREVDVAEGSGDMQFDPVGTQYTALKTATDMIVISDNTATNMLIARLGGIEVLNQRFQGWGLTTTKINNLLPDLSGTNVATPREMVQVLTMVAHGELLSLRSRDRLLEIMRQTVTNTLLPAGIDDPTVTVAHKTGDIGSLVGDTGIIDAPNGKRYVAAIMVRRPHNDDRAQELIRQITRTAYTYLSQSSQLPTPSPTGVPSPSMELPSAEALPSATPATAIQ